MTNDEIKDFLEQEHQRLLDELNLEWYIDDMDVPENRKKDYHWLARNIQVRNGDHENINLALTILKRLIK